ncbi:hypothetical protein CCR75_001980 [Bremia lactucae]|uniref:Uncharacterized protein n=1 Tax=Bremia lactucae TaxID=4779 RepID=A0A976IEE5_BRELC|nr:hypothetical protein CCR75_001692 [Bremia lactucae]TDH66030.1 hypothetical protein CCR75_001395 [Bremia lactucae]TDH66246.1 hypothetical protein CCR75_001836 [Bremia lactucae]TDH66354.1 hypothetical protein CCR75_001714 [Bremia lactucae]TDH66609.1 hypothetical protein CCR75_005613 [Bremia lactucae]
MQVHRRWLRFVLVVLLMNSQANAQIFAVQSRDGDPETVLNFKEDLNNGRVPTLATQRPERPWLLDQNASSDSSEPAEPSTPTPEVLKPTDAPSTRAPLTSASPGVNNKDVDATDKPLPVNKPVDPAKRDANRDKATGVVKPKDETTEVTFTRSPLLQQTAPVSDAIPTADSNANFDKPTSSPPTEVEIKPEESKPVPNAPPKSISLKVRKQIIDPESGSDDDASVGSKSDLNETQQTLKPPTKKDASTIQETLESNTVDLKTSKTSDKTTKQDNLSDNGTDSKQEADTSRSSSSSGSPSAAASVLADAASNATSTASNTLMLGLMMAGAIALVLLVALFVYKKTNQLVQDDDPGLERGRHDHTQGVAQASTVAANYHQNHNMSPTGFSDDNYPPNPGNSQFDQEPYDHDGGRLTYNDPNLDMLTPRSQIALAHSQMSLPPMAQTNSSHGTSQYSQYSSQSSSFYGQSMYSSGHSGNHFQSKYDSRHREDLASEDESDFGGDSIQDLSNGWHGMGQKGSKKTTKRPDLSLDESFFEPKDSRSTSASDYHGQTRFQASGQTEYRMSTADESRYMGDESFAATNSNYDQSHYNGDPSFQSSGFSEFEASGAPRRRGDSSNHDASSFYRTKDSRFTDASYY